MAKLLHRIGGFSARKPFVVIIAWFLVLIMAGVGYGFGHGALSDVISIPGTETMRVADELSTRIPSLSGGSGTAVFTTTDGKAFTPAQKKAIQQELRQVATLNGVKKTVDPFTAQQEKDDGVAKVNDGVSSIANAETTLATNRQKLNDAQQQLDDGKKKLADGKKQLASGQLALITGEQKLANGQQQINTNREKILLGQSQLSDANTLIDSKSQQISDGLAQVSAKQKMLDANRQKVVSAKQQLDAASATINQAKAKLDSAQIQHDSASAQIAQAQQQLTLMQEQRDKAQNTITDVQQQLSQLGCPASSTADSSQECAALQQQLTAAQTSHTQATSRIDSIVAGFHVKNGGITDERTLTAYLTNVRNSLDAAQQQISSGRAKLNYDAVSREIAQHRSELNYDSTIAALIAGQQQLNAASTQLTSGQQQLNAAKTTMQGKQSEITLGLQKLAAAQEQIDTGLAQLQTGQQSLNKASQTIADNEKQIATHQQQITDGLATINTAEKELPAKKAELADATKLVDLAKGISVVSADRSTALGTVIFNDDTLNVQPSVKQAVMTHISKNLPAGVAVEYASDISRSVPEMGSTEIIGVIAAAVVLFIMLGTLVAAGLPLISAIVGVGVGTLASLSFSGMVSMMSVTPVLGLMLGLAVGIDYSLFILNRHRRQLLNGMPTKESIALATGTSGSAVVFAASTVVIALLALNVTGIGFLGLMGDVAAICIVMAMLLSVTLVPALLSLLGMKILPRRKRRAVTELRNGASQTAQAVKPMSTVRAAITLVAGLVALIVIALPAASMRLGIPDGSSEPVTSTQYKAYKTMASQFGEGSNGPLVVTATLPKSVAQDDVNATKLAIAQRIASVNDVKAVAPVGVSANRDYLAFQVYPKTGPTSAQTEQLVHDLRNISPTHLTVTGHSDTGSARQAFSGTVTLGVSGNASMNIDMSEKIASVLPTYLIIVIGLSFLILMVVFRSILVPLIAAGGFALSVLSTFGGLTALFQWGWFSSLSGVHDPGPVLSFLPVLLIGILFGLAMDYQLFLVSGMREAYVKGADPRSAVTHGLKAGRTVVIAAAIIMVAVFMGFAGSISIMIKSIGFGLAFGVLVDAFVVRMLIVPASMHLLGHAAWWFPSFLDRILPHIDAEGTSLEPDTTEELPAV
ncbi:MMPL family transporter [Bifidobacterium aquikefiricola]|uniref:MMPL family transporter n=1 Tax=Bifidobacterium aquikefiricola TaxID=3059038 RepID=A0AB39U929_9BIFI